MYYQSLRLILIYSWCILLTIMLVSITYNSNMRLPTLCSFGASSSPPTMTSISHPFNTRIQLQANGHQSKNKEQFTGSQSLEFWKHNNILSIFRGGVTGELVIQVKRVSQDEKVSISVCLCQHVPPPKAAHAYRIFYFEGWY